MKLIRFIGFIASLLIAIGLLLGCLSPYLSPNTFWPLAFFGLAFPLFFVLNLLILIYWAIRRHKIVFISLAAFLPAILNTPLFIQVHGIAAPQKYEGKLVNVISFNTHYMGAYDFHGTDSNYFFKMMDTISPDIICMQEFINVGGLNKKPMIDRFFSQYRNYAAVNADSLSTTFPSGFGVCIFSKYPICNKGFLELENQNSNLTVFADILIGNDTIRVVNTHLKSIVFDNEDYKTVEELKAAEERPDSHRLKRIVNKLKFAFKDRAKQADKIREKLFHCPYKVILCGDFNDSPTSYAYHTIRANMRDAFKESGIGMSRTYTGKMPSFRIDYILHDKSWESYNYKTTRMNFSDHKMISCSILIPK